MTATKASRLKLARQVNSRMRSYVDWHKPAMEEYAAEQGVSAAERRLDALDDARKSLEALIALERLCQRSMNSSPSACKTRHMAEALKAGQEAQQSPGAAGAGHREMDGTRP